MVSVEQLKPYKEYDRSMYENCEPDGLCFPHKRYFILKESIKQFGIKKPIWIFIHSNGKIHIAEGNTRLAIAEELGIKNIPARVFYYDREDKHNMHKLPPRPVTDNRKMKLITRPSTLGFTRQ